MAVLSYWRNLLLGCGSVIVSNCCFLSVSYIAKHQPVSPGEIMTSRSVVQIIIFGSSFMFKSIRNGSKALEYKWRTWAALALCLILLTSMQILCFITVKMLPLSDFIVLVFTAPVFTLIFATLPGLGRIRPSLIDVILCLAIVVGSAFVSQPTFMFGAQEGGAGEEHGSQYGLGVGLSIGISAIGGLFQLLSGKCKDIPIDVFMVTGAQLSLICGLAYCSAYPNPKASLDFAYLGILVLSSASSLGGILFMQVAVIFINPVLVSVLRTFEIVMALVLEICVSSYMFDFGNVSFAYKVAGSAAVTLSAIIMAVSDKIGELLPEKVAQFLPKMCCEQGGGEEKDDSKEIDKKSVTESKNQETC